MDIILPLPAGEGRVSENAGYFQHGKHHAKAHLGAEFTAFPSAGKLSKVR
jgi:hypothetical protein